MLNKHHHYHTNPLRPCLSIFFQTHVKTCLHHNFFSWWVPAASNDSCILGSAMNASHSTPPRETLPSFLVFHMFCVFWQKEALLLLASRMFVSLTVPTTASQGQRWTHIPHVQRHSGTSFAFLLLDYYSNNWRLQN